MIPEEIEDLIKRLAKYNKVYSYDEDDLMQEFRMIYFNCLKNFDETKDVKFITYFTTACKNKIIKLRKKNKEQTLELNEDFVLDDTYEVKKRDLVHLLEKLPYGQYGIMYFVKGMKQSEIAKYFNVSTVWVNLKIKELKEKLQA